MKKVITHRKVNYVPSARLGLVAIVLYGRTKKTSERTQGKVSPILRTVLQGGAISHIVWCRAVIWRNDTAVVFPGGWALECIG